MSYPWRHHGYVRFIVHRYIEDAKVYVEVLHTDTFQLGFISRKDTAWSWVRDEVAEFGEERVKDILDKPSYDEIRKAGEIPAVISDGLFLKVVDMDSLPEVLPDECYVEIVGEFWYWGGMTFNGESEEFDADSEIRNPQLRLLTGDEKDPWVPCDGTNCRKSCCKAYDGEMVQLT